MNRASWLFALVLCVTLGAGSAACARKRAPAAAPAPAPPAVTPAPPSPAPPPPPLPPPPPAPLTEEEIFKRKTLEELNADKPFGDAFFDYDQSTLREDARAALQRNVEWLKKWPSTKVSVEGHCDSRGSSEYNLALGDRRASAVKAYLTSLGIGTDRVLNVSKGEEQPFCREENESCWAQNRRGHFVVTAK